jgi:antitoxin VapB
MSLNIKNPEAHALAARLAKKTGETLTDAVTTALRERLERFEQTTGFDEQRYQKLKAIAADCRKHMKEPYLSTEHGDLLYDERGLPK